MDRRSTAHLNGDDKAVTSRVLASAKYRHLDPYFVGRIATEACRTSSSNADAVKDAKRRLHQAFGAFVLGNPASAVLEAVEKAAAEPLATRHAFARAMRTHASTVERLPEIEEIAGLVWSWCGSPASVIDLACGLNPLIIPWLTLAPDASYWCCDIDTHMVAALARLGTVLPVQLHAECRDLVADPPSLEADLCFMLKTVTTLEQQKPGQFAAVLRGLRSRHVIVSLPRRSLGGGRAYAVDPIKQVERLIADVGYEIAGDSQTAREHFIHLLPRSPSRTRNGSPP